MAFMVGSNIYIKVTSSIFTLYSVSDNLFMACRIKRIVSDNRSGIAINYMNQTTTSITGSENVVHHINPFITSSWACCYRVGCHIANFDVGLPSLYRYIVVAQSSWFHK